MNPQRYFFEIAPEFPPSKRWIVTVREFDGMIKGIVVCDNKLGLLDAIDQALPDDNDGLDIQFETN